MAKLVAIAALRAPGAWAAAATAPISSGACLLWLLSPQACCPCPPRHAAAPPPAPPHELQRCSRRSGRRIFTFFSRHFDAIVTRALLDWRTRGHVRGSRGAQLPVNLP